MRINVVWKGSRRWIALSARFVIAPVLLASLLVGLQAATVGTASTASADVADATCVGTQTTTYSPGLTLVPTQQNIQISWIYAPCVSVSEPAISSALSSATRQAPVSCLSIGQVGSSVRVITWNTGQTSTFSYNAMSSIVNGDTVVTLTGSITAEEVIVSPSLNLLGCLTPPGITSLFSTTTLVITSL
jgi:hypothetical protein